MTTQDPPPQPRALSRCTPDSILVIDAEGRVTQYVPASDCFLGYQEQELVGQRAMEYVHPADTETALDIGRSLSTGETSSVRVRFRTAEGEWVPVQTAINRPAEDTVAAYVVSMHQTAGADDGSRRQSVEREAGIDALRELYEIASTTDLSFETKRLRILELGRRRLDLPYAFVSRITEDTQTIVASAGDHELLQTGASCPIEKSYCRKTIHTEGLLALFDAVEEGFDSDPAYDEFGLGSYIGGKLVGGDDLYGTMCFAGSAPRTYEFTDSERTFVKLASRWLGYELEQRKYQAELKRQNDRLENFASVVSHDLRNPLSVVEGRLAIARQEHDIENLQTATEALDRTFDLIDEVLEFARMGQEVTDTEPVSLSSVAIDAWEMVDSDEVSLSIENDSIRVAADPARLQRLLENLFRNSIDHGGEALTTIRLGPLPDGFYVADDGCGIPGEKSEKVFEGGYTTASQGTGFGLSIVKEITEAHSWSVSLTTSTNGGARFEFLGTDPSAI